MDYADLYDRAHAAGEKAMKECTPTPIVIRGSSGRTWYEPGGVCGFAWVNVRPRNSRFARWLMRHELAYYPATRGGVDINVKYGGQSYERKVAYAKAFARVLVEAGINATAEGRLD